MGLISRVSSRTYRKSPSIKKIKPKNVNCPELSVQDYIMAGFKDPKYLPHTAGRSFNKIRFRKSQCSVVERLINSLMMHGRNNGKKMLTMRIVRHTFEIIHLTTNENPLQVLVNAIKNSG